MASSVPTLAYSKDDFPGGETSFVRTDASGQRYKIRSSSAIETNHAMALFTGDTYPAHWQPGTSGGQSIYYKNFDGQMSSVPGNAQWVEIKLPSQYVLTEYTLHHNMPYDGQFQGPQNSNVPTAWMVLGSGDRTNWTLLHMDNRGINAWKDDQYDGFSTIKNGTVKGITGNQSPFQYFRFVFTNWAKGAETPRLDRIKMMVSGGAPTPEGDDTGDSAPRPSTGSAAAGDGDDENKIQEFIEEYKWYLLAAAVAILVAVIMYT